MPHNYTILLADCDERFLKVLASSLTDTGFTVFCANSGEQALQISREYSGTIDVLVSDAQLCEGGEAAPTITGIELARVFRAQRPSATIVLMSERNLEMLVRSYGREFIRRPCLSDALNQSIIHLMTLASG